MLGMSLPPCCRFHPAEIEMPRRSDFGIPCCLRPSVAGSTLGPLIFEATCAFTFVTARWLVISPRETLSIGFRVLVARHPAIQTTGRLTFAPAGLPPAEHASLRWTHNQDMQISRIRLSDKTSRLHPRHVVPKPGEAYEPEVPVKVRKWISPAPASPGFVLDAQPPAQPHSGVVVDRPVRF